MLNTAPDNSQPAGADLHIAVGIIRDAANRILIARRREGTPGAGLWEFPGGKCEANESIHAALARELREELGIDVKQARPLIRIAHAYPDRHVMLDTWDVTDWAGEAKGLEGQVLAWVPADELASRALLPANRPLMHAAQLPELYAFSPEPGDDWCAFLDALSATLSSGIRLLRLRAPGLDDVAYERLARECLALCHETGAQLMVDRGSGMQQRLGADGLHLRAGDLLALTQRPESRGWLAASCHNPEELRHAEALGCDFVVLGSVQPTDTHPASASLGWSRAAELMEAARLPVFCIGGMRREDVPLAWQSGAQGIAGIRGLWSTG